MAKTATKKMDVADTRSAESRTHESSAPLWKEQEGRVQGALWRHLQEDGKSRFTISVSRSYMDKDKEWQSVHYFDEKDLDDVHTIADQAKNEIQRLKGLAVNVDED